MDPSSLWTRCPIEYLVAFTDGGWHAAGTAVHGRLREGCWLTAEALGMGAHATTVGTLSAAPSIIGGGAARMRDDKVSRRKCEAPAEEAPAEEAPVEEAPAEEAAPRCIVAYACGGTWLAPTPSSIERSWHSRPERPGKCVETSCHTFCCASPAPVDKKRTTDWRRSSSTRLHAVPVSGNARNLGSLHGGASRRSICAVWISVRRLMTGSTSSTAGGSTTRRSRHRSVSRGGAPCEQSHVACARTWGETFGVGNPREVSRGENQGSHG